MGQSSHAVPVPIRGVLGPGLGSAHYSRKEHGRCFPTVFWHEASRLCSLSHCLVCATSLPQMRRHCEITGSTCLPASLGQRKAKLAPQVRELPSWAFEALDRPLPSPHPPTAGQGRAGQGRAAVWEGAVTEVSREAMSHWFKSFGFLDTLGKPCTFSEAGSSSVNGG